MAKKDYYEILGLSRDASDAQIRKAFRKIRQQRDRHAGDKQAEATFAEATEAFDTLIDPEKRLKYDRAAHPQKVPLKPIRLPGRIDKWQQLLLPHLGTILLFIVVGFLYFSPVLQGKVLNQSDMTYYQGMTKEARDFYDQTSQHPLWSNSMFSGMPTYITFTGPSSNLVGYMSRIATLYLPSPVNMIFIAMLGFYILACVLGFRYWIRLVGAVAFGLSSFNIILISAGHVTELMTFSYLSPVIAGILLTYRGKYLAGGLLALVALALMIYSNHLQIIYYGVIVILGIAVSEFVRALKKKSLPEFFKASMVLLVAAVLAILPASGNLMVTKEYAKYSTRESESGITLQNRYNTAETKGGLDINYAYDWSVGKLESLSILVPDIYGGPATPDFISSSKLYSSISEAGQTPDQAASLASRLAGFYYWGPQPFTTPVYFGAIICFLFVLSLFLVKGWDRWWLLAVTLIGFLLSWGKNFAVLNDFLFYHLPYYNKFRSPSMALVMPELTFTIFACWAVHELTSGKYTRETLWKAVRTSLLITGGVVLILVSGMLLDFSGPKDAQLPQMLGSNSPVVQRIIGAIREDRASMLHSDGFRSLILVLLTGLLFWAYVRNKVRLNIFGILLTILLLFDLVQIDKRYVNNDAFMDATDQDNIFQASQADQIILQDKDPYYRVLNLTAPDIFSDAVTSYFHKSIGGYSPAKLWRYEDLIDFQIQPSIQHIITTLEAQGPKDSTIMQVFHTSSILNMLNTRYFIINPSAPPVRNYQACGNSWFVGTIHQVPDPNNEILSLTDFNPLDSAIMDRHEMTGLMGFRPYKDAASTVRLTKYGLNELQYASSNAGEGLAVFSDIYYPAGWTAYVDGKSSPILRVNYALRGLRVPAGQHQIIFRFHPGIYYTGESISLITSLLLIFIFIAGLIYVVLEYQKSQVPQLPAT
jgi:hypothetical protein